MLRLTADGGAEDDVGWACALKSASSPTRMRGRGVGAPRLILLARKVEGCAAVERGTWRRMPTINQGGARENDGVGARREFGDRAGSREARAQRKKALSRRPSEWPSLLPAWTRSGAAREAPSRCITATWARDQASQQGWLLVSGLLEVRTEAGKSTIHRLT